MERLTIDEIIEHCEIKTKFYEEVGKSIDFETIELTDAIKEYWEHKQVKEYLEELKRYRDLEEQGLLLRLPCKVGDTIYYIEDNNVNKFVVYSFDIRPLQQFVFNYDGIRLNFKNFGNTVFLTQAEAEQKLKEMESVHFRKE